MNRPSLGSMVVMATLATTFLVAQTSHADSATWNLDPISSDWNTAENWTPPTVPNGPTDTATFDVSNNSAVSIAFDVEVDGIVFDPGASAFNITTLPTADGTNTLTISGAGVNNQSETEQNIVAGADGFKTGAINFRGSANAGSEIVYTAAGNNSPGVAQSSVINFFDNADAGSAHFVMQSSRRGSVGQLGFSDDSTAANATFFNHGFLGFTDNATAANAVINDNIGFLTFFGTSTAANAVVNQRAANITFGDFATAADATFTLDKSTVFFGSSATAANAHFTLTESTAAFSAGTAGNATFILEGGALSGASGSVASFTNTATAENATITANGGAVAGAGGALILFSSNGFGRFEASAGNATLIANGGSGGAPGGTILFQTKSFGGNSRIELFGNGSLDISQHYTFTILAIGSLEGNGLVFLGDNVLKVGTNNLETIFSGTIQDGGVGGGTGGSLKKLGRGTLTLTGANTYTGNTAVAGGTLLVNNVDGSGTGTGPVTVLRGTLGGRGTIDGPVTLGTGSGAGAYLAPAAGTNRNTTLTLQGSLIFEADATYTYTFKASGDRVKTDKVIANGVTINGGMINLVEATPATLSVGLVLTVISNTATTPIAGTFSNLPDGAIVTVNGNNFQASYEGGDGNDLTLTVVP
jgi:autotransporter-associated beta strand protein